MNPMTLAAVATSALSLFLICAGDPKRRRTARLAGGEQGRRTRRTLVAAACVPGLLLAVLGDAAAVLIWLGGCSLTGWLLALGFVGPAGDRIVRPGSADPRHRFVQRDP